LYNYYQLILLNIIDVYDIYIKSFIILFLLLIFFYFNRKIEYESEYHPCTTDCEYGSITTMGNNVLENLKSLKFL